MINDKLYMSYNLLAIPFNKFAATIGPKKPPLCNRIIFLLFSSSFQRLTNFSISSSEIQVSVSYSRGLRHYLLTCFLVILSYLTVNFVFPNLTDSGFTSVVYYIFFTIFLLHQVLAVLKNLLFVFLLFFFFVFFYVSKIFDIFLRNSSIRFIFSGLVILSSHGLLTNSFVSDCKFCISKSY